MRGGIEVKSVKFQKDCSSIFFPPIQSLLQPAEKLWTLVDEPLVNKCFETIDEIEEILVRRCNILSEMREEIRSLTYYDWLDFH